MIAERDASVLGLLSVEQAMRAEVERLTQLLSDEDSDRFERGQRVGRLAVAAASTQTHEWEQSETPPSSQAMAAAAALGGDAPADVEAVSILEVGTVFQSCTHIASLIPHPP